MTSARRSSPVMSHQAALLCSTPSEIETNSGIFIDVAAPRADLINVDDIAHGLALTCRYGGQSQSFFSVAEHSVLVYDLLRWMGEPADVCFGGLLHDAPEAYLGDIVTPLKHSLRQSGRSVYDELNARLELAIGEAFDVDPALFEDPRVKTADLWALRIEARRLTFSGGRGWRWSGTLPNDGDLPREVQFSCGLDWKAARTLFRMRYESARESL